MDNVQTIVSKVNRIRKISKDKVILSTNTKDKYQETLRTEVTTLHPKLANWFFPDTFKVMYTLRQRDVKSRKIPRKLTEQQEKMLQNIENLC